VVEFHTHGQSDLLVHAQNISFALAFAFVDLFALLDVASLDVP
jgi:hypothetical protein